MHGLTVNAFMSVSLDPPLVLVSIERRTKLCRLLDEGRSYGVSVLRESQSGLSDHFAHRAAEGVPEPRFDLIRDTPLVEGALAHFVATIIRCYWGGDHCAVPRPRRCTHATARERRCCSTAAATSGSAEIG